jgi:hypothetical protein
MDAESNNNLGHWWFEALFLLLMTAGRVTRVRMAHVPRTRRQPYEPNETHCRIWCGSDDLEVKVKPRWITTHLHTGQPSAKQDGMIKKASSKARPSMVKWRCLMQYVLCISSKNQ